MLVNIRLKGRPLIARLPYILFFLVLFAFRPAVAAPDSIQPYGDFNWDDSYTTVLNKLSKIETVKNIHVIQKFSMKGVEARKIKSITRFLLHNPEENNTFLKQNNCEAYLDGVGFDGKEGIIKIAERLELSSPFLLAVDSILIFGEPFQLFLEFWPTKGLLLEAPEDAICAQEIMPVVLVRTYLRSPDFLSPVNREKIIKILNDKYGANTKGNGTIIETNFGNRFEDTHTFTIYQTSATNFMWFKHYNDGHLVISYDNLTNFNYFQAEFTKKYGEVIAEMNNKEGGGEKGL